MGLFSGIFGGGGKAARKAAEIQADAINRGITLQTDTFNAGVEQSAPQREIGFQAGQDLATASGLPGASFRPDFRAKLGETGGGTELAAAPLADRTNDLLERFRGSALFKTVFEPALERSEEELRARASATGNLDSGRLLEALQENAGDLGNRTFTQHLGLLSDQAGTGNQFTAQNTQNALGTSANIAGAELDKGNALAQGVINKAASKASAFKSLGNLFGTGVGAFVGGTAGGPQGAFKGAEIGSSLFQ